MEILQRILIVEGHTAIEAGVRVLLAGEADIEVLVRTNEDDELALAVGALTPHLLLMDTTMSGTDAVTAVAEMKRRYPDARVLLIVSRNIEDFALANLQAGANGCIRQDATHAEFRAAIRSVLEGKTYLSTNVPKKTIYAYAGSNSPGAGSARDPLTPRERDVLKLVAAGKSSRCIAKLLSLSVKTVGKHRANMMSKLDVHNAAALTAYAIARGLN